MTPVIFGLEGLSLTRIERDFFKETRPFGFILFGRNIADRQQLQRLTGELRALTGNDQLPVLIDQEGGRVARMQAPQWATYPPAATFEVAKRTFTMPFAPMLLACIIMRWRASLRDSFNKSVYCLSSPPTKFLKPAKMSFPRCFARTVEPVTKPNELTTDLPGMVSTFDM